MHNRLIGCILGLCLVGAILVGGASTSGASSLTEHEWRVAIENLGLRGAGCFKASYPAMQWNPTPCSVAPDVPVAPAPSMSSDAPATTEVPTTIGNGTFNDYAAYEPGGLIQSAIGTFADVSPEITESGPVGGPGNPPVANAFSLQMNTENFATSACQGGESQCLGWQQFVFLNNQNSLFMQYWLINYGPTCPSGWSSTTLAPNDCYQNSPAQSLPVPLTAGALRNVQVDDIAGFPNDSAELAVGGGAIEVSNPDGVLGLASQWNTAEWNVFGDDNGGEATFGPDTTLEPVTQLVGSSQSAPKCTQRSFTGETNNLTMTATPPLSNGSGYPEIASEQTNGALQTQSCATFAPPPTLNGELNVAYHANNGSDDLFRDSTSDDLAWPAAGSQISGLYSSAAPAIVEYGNEFVMAVTSSNGTNDIYISTSTNGVKWTRGTIVAGQSTPTTPALADYKGTLVMAYVADNGSNDIIVTTTKTPQKWLNNSYAIPAASPTAPAMVAYKGDLVMAYQLNDGSHRIGVTYTTDPSRWYTKGYIVKDQLTDASPALAVYNNQIFPPYTVNKLVMAVVAVGTDANDIFVSTTSSPTSWPNDSYAIAQQSPNAPSLFAWAGKLVMAFGLNNGSNMIGITDTFTPSDWAATDTTYLSNQFTDTTPVLY
jgi:hypothetical protein